MSASDPSPCDPAPAPPPAPDLGVAEAQGGEQEALRRAMPVQRLLASGLRYDDALALHELSSDGISWARAGCWLAERNLRLAEASTTAAGQRSYFRYASACFRAAQSAWPTDTPAKARIFGAMVDAYARAAALDEPPTEKHEIAWRDGALCGWLHRPANVDAPPVVVIMGGFDGWREEYWPCAEQLVQRGIAAFLVDGPGQGESRIRHRLYLDEHFHQAFSAIADHLAADSRLGQAIGIWGNSLGGFLAAQVASADPRFAALCVNGGSARPIELPERFPRFWEKVEALVGGERQRAEAIFAQFDLTGPAQAIRCPLLQIHSEPDQVFRLGDARKIHDLASSADKTILIWRDGDHCIYNHFEEKNAIVADWFVEKLK